MLYRPGATSGRTKSTLATQGECPLVADRSRRIGPTGTAPDGIEGGSIEAVLGSR
jgi:hypothetical protein